MSSVPLKTKNKVIVDFINGRKFEDISLEERISYNSVEEIVKEWKEGYLNIDLGNDIAQELKDLAFLAREKEITVQDIIEGYQYYTIFKDKEKEKVLRIVNEIYAMDEEKRKSFFSTAEKMMELVRYKNIEYVEIPKAIEDMVKKGKEIKKEIKANEIINLDKLRDLDSMKEEIKKLEQEKKSLEQEISFSKYLKKVLSKGKEDEEAMKDFIESAKHSDFSLKKAEEAASQISLLKKREIEMDQFLKISKYFEELMNLGLTVAMMEKLLNEVNKYDEEIDDYLNERSIYMRDKSAYARSVKELMDTHKKLEKQVKSLEDEIGKKKLKLQRF